MNIRSIDNLGINLYRKNALANQFKTETPFVNGKITEHEYRDLLEISPEGRRLADEAIQHHTLPYYGTAEIYQSLQEVMEGLDPEVKEAINYLIQSNLMPDGSIANPEDRAALLEMGLVQARYLAEHYLSGDRAARFLETIDKIAAIAQTRTVDPDTGAVSYLTPFQRPEGAPEDYINHGELMRLVEPETYKKLHEQIIQGGDWARTLVDFVIRAAEHPEWRERYFQEQDSINARLNQVTIENRYQEANRSEMASFLKDMERLIQQETLANRDLLRQNMAYFFKLLEKM
ncbi:MAG TPA: hypothetical protein PLC07_12015 [Bacillota bacterium]|nr:hypothetical protein [Bacillota bacterium]